MSILFAATYPERTLGLVLYGTFASVGRTVHHRFGAPDEQLQQQIDQVRRTWGTPESGFLQVYGPSVAGDPEQRQWWARHQRISASPGAVSALMRMNAGIDIRHVLPAIRVPTLVLHRANERLVEISQGRYLAEQIPGARFKELSGIDHVPWLGDVDEITDAVEEFLTGAHRVTPADSVLATVLVVDSADLHDSQSREGQLSYAALIRREVARYRGREIAGTPHDVLATFDGPTRAVRCACGITAGARALGIEARIGVHTGEVELRGDAVSGVAVDTCARVAALACPGEVLASGTVIDLVAGSGFQFADRGTLATHEGHKRWQIFEVRLVDGDRGD